MAEIKIAGIMRAGEFSPNHIGNDAAILNAVAEQLRKRGCEVNIYSEEQFVAGGLSEDTVLAMCRGHRSISLLQRLEDEGRLVINSGYGIENCIRERLPRLLAAAGIAFPESIVADTDEMVKMRLMRGGFGGCWVKRADSHTRHREDVSYARHPQEAQELLQEFFLRGIKRALICRHVPGELVKFYGVAGTPFFHCFYHSDVKAPVSGFDAGRLRDMCSQAAETLDVRIYGGGCIVGPDGAPVIIDFSDWPSFVSCRGEAATAIARMVMNEIKHRKIIT